MSGPHGRNCGCATKTKEKAAALADRKARAEQQLEHLAAILGALDDDPDAANMDQFEMLAKIIDTAPDGEAADVLAAAVIHFDTLFSLAVKRTDGPDKNPPTDTSTVVALTVNNRGGLKVDVAPGWGRRAVGILHSAAVEISYRLSSQKDQQGSDSRVEADGSFENLLTALEDAARHAGLDPKEFGLDVDTLRRFHAETTEQRKSAAQQAVRDIFGDGANVKVVGPIVGLEELMEVIFGVKATTATGDGKTAPTEPSAEDLSAGQDDEPDSKTPAGAGV